MDGFKNSTRTQYMKGGSADCYAKGGEVKGAAKISKVMGEFKSGALHSGSKKGPEVTSPKQAVAIALSEARKAGAPIPKKAAGGQPTAEETRRSRQQDEQLRRVQVSPAEQRVMQSAERVTKVENQTRMPKKATGGMVGSMPRPLVMAAPAPTAKVMVPNTKGNAMRATPVRGPVPRLKRGGLAVMPRGKNC